MFYKVSENEYINLDYVAHVEFVEDDIPDKIRHGAGASLINGKKSGIYLLAGGKIFHVGGDREKFYVLMGLLPTP